MTTNPVLDQYQTGQPIVSGTYGHLTDKETQLLKLLWTRLFVHFKSDTNALNSMAVTKEEEEEEEEMEDNRGKLSTRARLEKTASPTPSEKSSSSSWFSFGGVAKEEHPVEYRQLVGEVAAQDSLPPSFETASKSFANQAIRDAFWNAASTDHPDVLVLRFLRARKWNVDDALAMLLACLKWRLQEDIDYLVWAGESELNLRLMRAGFGVLHKTDRLGQPVIHIPVRLNDPKAQPHQHIVDYTIYLMEVARVVLRPPVEKVCLVFDTTDMSMANMDWTFFKKFLSYLENYYPECLGLVIVYNASWVFNSLWKLIRPLLDPVVASKVHFASTKEELAQFIDPANLPKSHQGTSDFSYTYKLPQPNENKAMFDGGKRDKLLGERSAACLKFEMATSQWIANNDDNATSIRADAADQVIGVSKQLDKYLRARTLYHRMGVIDEHQNMHWEMS